jgi:hypothetical protein
VFSARANLLDVLELDRRELDVGGAEVLLESVELRRPGDWHNLG